MLDAPDDHRAPKKARHSSLMNGARPYILLPQHGSGGTSHGAGGSRAGSAAKTDALRVEALEASLREMRTMAAQSPASMSFSNFHSLLMLPDFPRPPALPAQPQRLNGGAAPAVGQISGTQQAPLAGPSHLSLNGGDDSTAGGGHDATSLPLFAQAMMPPSIPHKLTPWEELSIRRDSEQRPYRDVHLLTGKRKRRRSAHPSWADGGITLPLISSKLLGKVESALRLGLCKMDAARLIAGGAGFLVAPQFEAEKTIPSVSAEEEAARVRRRHKRRRLHAGHEIGGGANVPRFGGMRSPADAEVDGAVLELIERIRQPGRDDSAHDEGGEADGSDVESAYESEVDEWEVEVSHAISQRSHAHASSTSEIARRLGKALAVPLSANSTLLQVPLGETERRAWNEEARQQRQIRLAEGRQGGSQQQRQDDDEEGDPESTLPVGTQGDVAGSGGAGPGGMPSDAEPEELEATLAIASEQMLYELTSGDKAG
ncbi:hypothetical protein OC844_006774 [Tilletia horrida]|nr:hypothetical protein OC844_006774 [Tilletia horrida]